jgi:hypothetical protein
MRDRISDLGYFNWQIADMVGVSDITFTKWMRKEMPKTDERRIKIESVLDQLERGG